MPPKKIPGTGEVYFSNPHTGDRVINLRDYPQVDASVRNEDITIIGTFTDYAGSGGRPPTQVMLAGIQNELSGDPLARSQGAKDPERTERGNIAATKRQRPRLIYMEN